MTRLCVVTFLFTIIFIALSNAFLSDFVKQIKFTRLSDGSKEFNFEYPLDNGKLFHGKTWLLINPNEEYVYVMFGANQSDIYWVEMTHDEFMQNNSFRKSVRLANKTDDLLIMRSDFVQLTLDISKGYLPYTPYQTEWDFDSICFIEAKNNNHTFNYTISSKNNSRKFNGTTYYESKGDPFSQLIHIYDWPQRDSTHEVIFTDHELHSRNEIFCKGISKTISACGISAAYVENDINPKLLKLLSKQNNLVQ